MGVYLLGPGAGQEPPFSRSFFNTKLGDIIAQNGKDAELKLTLFLIDGTTHDVCDIVELADQYITVRVYQPDDDTCQTSLNIIPYGAIYRLQISPKESDSERVGFRWPPSKVKAGRSSGSGKP